jgi:hypothetical protein
MVVDEATFKLNWEKIFGQTNRKQEGPLSEEPGTEHQNQRSQAEESAPEEAAESGREASRRGSGPVSEGDQ